MWPKMILLLLNILLISSNGISQDLSRDSHIFKPSDLVQKPEGFLNHFLDPS